MKASFLRILALIGAGLVSEVAYGQATVVVSQPVVRGRVVVINPQGMTVSVLQGGAPVVFYGLERARIERTGGRVGTFAELHPGTEVIVYYAAREGRWYPQRILIPDANVVVPSPSTVLSPGESRALDSKAANDGDITTNPGVKARIDDDITTQPGEKDPTDHDITKKRD